MLDRRLASVICCSALLLAASVLLGAQVQKPTAETPQLLMATIVSLKPGMVAEYVDLQIKEIMPAQRKGGSPGRDAWSSAVFGAAGTYAYFSPVASLAQFDSPSPIVRALGQEAANALQAKNAKMTDGARTLLIRTRPDLSYRPDPKAPPAAFLLVTEVEIVPGKKAEFEALLKKDVIPAMQQAKVRGYSVLEVVYGGSASSYFSAIGYDTFETIGKGHPFQIALGEEGARKLEAKTAGIVSGLERFIMRYRSDLSWKPGQTAP